MKYDQPSFTGRGAFVEPPFGTAGSTDAGLEFNYAVWTPNTRISFHNVPWNSDYRDLVHYANQADLDTYLSTVAGPVFPISTYAKVNEPIRVNLPFNLCYKHNYLRVYNPGEPVPGGDEPRVFYYFIKDVRFLAPNTTEIMVQLDVWQTFSRYLTFGNCYIERGHIGIANENAFDDHGRTFLTVPEGLDCGNEYVTVNALEYTIADTSSYNVLVASTTDLYTDPGEVTAPNMQMASGSQFEGLPNGMSLTLFQSRVTFTNYMARVSEFPWIAQGIVSIMLVPPVWNTLEAALDTTLHNIPSGVIGAVQALELMGGEVPGSTVSNADIRENYLQLPTRYAGLRKFHTYPYSAIEMTTYQGAPLVLKPECIATDGLYTRIAMHLAPPGPRIVVYPLKYNGKRYDTDALALADVHDDNQPMLNDRSEFMDFMTGIFDLPMFSIVNNSYLSYLASNRNSIAYQHSSADWSQSRAMTGVQLGYNQATNQMNTNMEQSFNNNQAMQAGANLQGNLAMARGGINAITGAAGGLTAGLARGGGSGIGAISQGGIGAVQDMGSAAIDYQQAMGMGAINNAQNTANMMLQRGNAAFMRDTNADYGNFAAQGDYANAIAAINARVQDAKLIQPTTSGQLGGEAFNIAAFKWGIFWKYKMLQPAVMAAIGEMWLRYGYAVNRFGHMPSTFRVMSKFTYWKLRETYISTSAMPEGFKQTVRGIFEKGVTVWTDPTDIGNIDIADNEPLSGVTL